MKLIGTMALAFGLATAGVLVINAVTGGGILAVLLSLGWGFVSGFIASEVTGYGE